MKIKIHHPEGTPLGSRRAYLVSRLEDRLRPLLNKFRCEEALVNATFMYVQDQWVCHLALHPPGRKILAASGQAPETEAAAEQAIAELSAAIEKHFSRLRAGHALRRKARAKRLEQLNARWVLQSPETQREARVRLDVLVKQLAAVARRELAYLRASGDFPASYPQVTDVVDEAVVATKAAWHPGSDVAALWRQLLRNLFAVIDREVAASRQFGAAIPLEAPVPADAMDVAESMVEDELYEYYQPDDTLTVADVLRDAGAGEGAGIECEPGEELAKQATVTHTMRALPIAWRRAIMLAEQEDLSQEEIAEIVAATHEQVGQWIEHARAYLQARLSDLGIGAENGLKRWFGTEKSSPGKMGKPPWVHADRV